MLHCGQRELYSPREVFRYLSRMESLDRLIAQCKAIAAMEIEYKELLIDTVRQAITERLQRAEISTVARDMPFRILDGEAYNCARGACFTPILVLVHTRGSLLFP